MKVHLVDGSAEGAVEGSGLVNSNARLFQPLRT